MISRTPRMISHARPSTVTGTAMSHRAWMSSGEEWNFESQPAHGA
jgi:hypothetical protein